MSYSTDLARHLSTQEVWATGASKCVVVLSADAQSIEVRIIEHGRMCMRRWFTAVDEAAAFAIESARAYGADV